MTEARWRFLQAITERIPEARIAELRLFPSLRQGGAESGVAVVAVEDLNAITSPAATSDPLAVDAVVAAEPALESAPAAPYADVIVPSGPLAADMQAADNPVAEAQVTIPVVVADVSVEEVDPGEPVPTVQEFMQAAQGSEGTEQDTDSETVAAPMRRYSVLSARYRLQLKGPDRGKWDFEMTHEADAPLETVDRVVRGVARRAGDDGEPERFTPDDLRAILAQPWWNTPA